MQSFNTIEAGLIPLILPVRSRISFKHGSKYSTCCPLFCPCRKFWGPRLKSSTIFQYCPISLNPSYPPSAQLVFFQTSLKILPLLPSIFSISQILGSHKYLRPLLKFPPTHVVHLISHCCAQTQVRDMAQNDPLIVLYLVQLSNSGVPG
jgi:hypothetical protein